MSDQTQQSNQLDVTQQTETESSAMTQKLPGPVPSTMANEPDRPPARMCVSRWFPADRDQSAAGDRRHPRLLLVRHWAERTL